MGLRERGWAESRIGTRSGRKEEGGSGSGGRKEGREASSSPTQPLPSRKFGFLPIPNIWRKLGTPAGETQTKHHHTSV